MTFTQLLTYLLVGIGLCFDTFAVSVSFGILKKEIRFRQACMIAFSLAFFQALFPLFGWIIGISLKNLIVSFDHWIAFILLAAIGAKMIYEGWKQEEERQQFDPMNPLVLISVSVATSIDALVVGVSFGFLDTPITRPVLIIGSVTFLAAMLGMLFGKKIPGKTSHRSLIVGGIILFLIGVKILAEHLLAFE